MRPSKKSLGVSVIVCLIGLSFAATLFGYYFYFPLAATVVVSLAAFLVRIRGIRSGLPEPYGRGKVSKIDVKGTGRSGFLLLLGGVLSTVGLLATVFFLPPVVFLALIFGFISGMPLSEVAYFILVARYEAISGSRIYLITEEAGQPGEAASLVKSFEMRRRRSGSAG